MLARSDLPLLHSLRCKNLHLDDIAVHEDCIIPFRIYVIMNNECNIYKNAQRKIRKLKSINDVRILRNIFNSMNKY